MSIHFCEECKQAFLPEQTKTDGERLFCKKCNVKLINLGSEKGQISLRGHLESQYGKKQQQNAMTPKSRKPPGANLFRKSTC